jgi:hypothetical protein
MLVLSRAIPDGVLFTEQAKEFQVQLVSRDEKVAFAAILTEFYMRARRGLAQRSQSRPDAEIPMNSALFVKRLENYLIEFFTYAPRDFDFRGQSPFEIFRAVQHAIFETGFYHRYDLTAFNVGVDIESQLDLERRIPFKNLPFYREAEVKERIRYVRGLLFPEWAHSRGTVSNAVVNRMALFHQEPLLTLQKERQSRLAEIMRAAKNPAAPCIQDISNYFRAL